MKVKELTTEMAQNQTLAIGDVNLDIQRLGAGPPLLLLHGEDGTLFAQEFISRLAEQFDVIVPSHPGWGRSSRPDYVTTIDDIAYLYLDLLRALRLPSVGLVGVSIGGWLAAEMATKCEAGISHLALIAPLGIKVRGRTDRDIADLYASAPEDVPSLLFSDTSRRSANVDSLDDAGLRDLGLAQEATVRYGWNPYMHNPKLLRRLRRITVPSLVVWGSDDRLVYASDYYRTYASAMGKGAEIKVIDGSGHRVEEEAADSAARLIGEFLSEQMLPVATQP
jgi:pimeloyl-ACP methyl ester carboxylesterase